MVRIILKYNEKSYKISLIYDVVYVTIKELKDVKIYSIIPLCLFFRYMNGCFEKINGNKYLTLVSTNERKEKLKEYEELLVKIRNLIKSITKNSDHYDENHMKVNSDDKLCLNKRTEIPTIAIVVRVIFFENNKYYPQAFSDKC